MQFSADIWTILKSPCSKRKKLQWGSDSCWRVRPSVVPGVVSWFPCPIWLAHCCFSWGQNLFFKTSVLGHFEWKNKYTGYQLLLEPELQRPKNTKEFLLLSIHCWSGNPPFISRTSWCDALICQNLKIGPDWIFGQFFWKLEFLPNVWISGPIFYVTEAACDPSLRTAYHRVISKLLAFQRTSYYSLGVWGKLLGFTQNQWNKMGKVGKARCGL